MSWYQKGAIVLREEEVDGNYSEVNGEDDMNDEFLNVVVHCIDIYMPSTVRYITFTFLISSNLVDNIFDDIKFWFYYCMVPVVWF